MKVSKTPLRVSFLGGGTDFPWFFDSHSGGVIAAPVNRYIYISSIPSYDQVTTYLKYSQYEQVEDLGRIEHPIFREILSTRNLTPRDWSVVADIPAGNGLASSSSFTVGLVNLANALDGSVSNGLDLALQAIDIEVNRLGEPIGVQDQCAAAVGGLNFFRFDPGPRLSSSLLNPGGVDFPFGITLVKVGQNRRSASTFTSEQEKFVKADPSALAALVKLRDLTFEAAETLRADVTLLPDLVARGWELKIMSNPNAMTPEVEEVMSKSQSLGALSGKLLGAGGSGFVMLLSERGATESLESSLQKRGHKVLSVEVSKTGSEVIDL